jgi:hypothetical protein
MGKEQTTREVLLMSWAAVVGSQGETRLGSLAKDSCQEVR